MMKNDIKILSIYTDWNRKGAEGHYGGVGWYRILNPMRKIQNVSVFGRYLIGGSTHEEKGDSLKKMDREGKIWFMKYVDDWKPIISIISAKRITKAKLVIDFDDDMFHVHPLNVAYKWHYPGSEKNEALRFFTKNADALIVSTHPLANSLAEFGKPIKVIPNCVDPAIWKVKPSKEKLLEVTGTDKKGLPTIKKAHIPHEKLRIGWISSTNHLQDVPIIMEPLKKLLQKYDVEFWVIGFPVEEFRELGKNVRLILGTKGYEEFPAFLKSLELDIAIAPLIDDQFNRGKSNIKWLEASMCGTPMVASKVYPYEHSIEHGKTGFLARTSENWFYYLEKLVLDEKLRKKMAKAAKAEALRHYNIKDHLKEYVNFFKTL